MPASAVAVANELLRIAADKKIDDITPVKLQKLLFFAQGWHLALTDLPLIDEQFEFWPYGPVAPTAYFAFKDFSGNPIEGPAVKYLLSDWTHAEPVIPDLESDFEGTAEEREYARNLLARVLDIYGRFSATKLSNMSHAAGSPWDRVRSDWKGSPPRGTDIPVPLMKEHFRSLIAEGDAAGAAT